MGCLPPFPLAAIHGFSAACLAQTARRVKVEPIDSPFFKLSVPTNIRGKPVSDSRVAPGMEICYKITFSARERQRDYNYDLIVTTEREKFIVPVRAIGAKAALVLPEDLSFGTVAVKTSVTKTIVVCDVSLRVKICIVLFTATCFRWVVVSGLAPGSEHVRSSNRVLRDHGCTILCHAQASVCGWRWYCPAYRHIHASRVTHVRC
jgi:hypothetical protein